MYIERDRERVKCLYFVHSIGCSFERLTMNMLIPSRRAAPYTYRICVLWLVGGVVDLSLN